MKFISKKLMRISYILISALLISSNALAGDEAERFDFNSIPSHYLTDKIDMRFITSRNFTVIQWDLKKGAKLPVHSHVNEQVIRVLTGDVEVHTGNSVYNIHSGEIMIFPANVTHGFTATSNSVVYEQQTPIREDFLQPGFIDRLSEYLKQNQ